ncbi:phthiodiolone/phenolphthiodiolone dimycocerosates ketoreductase [Mycobacterium kubicae]|uniref:LLM class flavin-dependent oxidoreductase n=1 Tax=Mycobacterium kubicae TaxID=120959 RepID=A0AAX1JCI1_9MYCO|nr:LLM class flavin-dependent oxidoreductase [Mycobacterium kubicae]MCV7098572.1 LLM class flavin-dependent oxidoreductase [Mycobacterium kubicae]ORV95845.1 photosystem I reaction center subunit VIII [Mycobacterium kubicae]QNI11014.1 LLM class flavin-dependent oxidoreductase [Mycobacterium kubicae]QPI39228.1 LLM class flavin-dependent oxidoreductase [Mycobacterium kubicae]GFG63769.1 phthiodiolone/phenolphthiodiolone dimycocerosates ketoreductase [Mycobacterium kubicae]
MLKVGLIEQPLHTRYSPTALVSAGYLTALATRMDSFWLPDHLNSVFPQSVMTEKYVGTARLVPNADAHHESWTVLGRLAGRNLGRLRLGIGVTDTGRRNPAATAQAAATLHHLTRGRAILGIGTGARDSNEPYGVDWAKPVGRFEEAVATIRALWNSAGELVSRDSPFFPLRNATFDLPPYRGQWPPLWIAAHRPRMLRITGRYADGWFPAAMFLRPEDYAAGLQTIRAAASNAGRDPMSLTAAGLFFVMTGSSRDEVDEALESQVMRAFALNAPAQMWARHGASHPLGDDSTGAQDIMLRTLDEQTIVSHTAHVPPSLPKELLLAGTPDDVIDQLAEWRDHGLRYPVIGNLSAVQPSLRRGLAANLPMAKILRRLRKL